MAPFFDPLRCPSCRGLLPARPLRCPSCGVELTGTTVIELVTTLRQADSLVDRMRTEMVAAGRTQPAGPLATGAAGPAPVTRPPARSWFAGRSVGVILLVLGALCVLAAGAVFIAVAWTGLPLAIRALILILLTASFALLAWLALRSKLQATAEAMAVIASGMFVLDLAAARRAGLPGLADLAAAPWEVVAGGLLVVAAGAGALALRSRQYWLWSLDAAVAFGMLRAAGGVLRLEDDGYAVSSVAVAVLASLLYVLWRRMRFPVSSWSAVVLGCMAWAVAVAVGAERAIDYVGADFGRVAQAWPTLAVALVAGFWSVTLSHPRWRRVGAFAALLPVLLVFEIVGWSHGWVAGTAVMLAGYAVAAVASARASATWSPAVGVSAAVLGLSAGFGLLPTMVELAFRIGLPMDLLTSEVLAAEVGPVLLPLTALVVLGLLPQVTIDRQRLRLDQRHTAGVFLATLAFLPILYGAGFWVSVIVLVVVAAVLLSAARLWRSDVLLIIGLLLLAIMRILAYNHDLADHDDLADPLAWTIIALLTFGWALAELRPMVRAGFLTAAGLGALAGAAQWLTYLQAPEQVTGLVVVVIGSMGLLASQGFPASLDLPGRALSRLVAEGVSVTWLVAGLAMAESSPSHRAVELTLAGVATGITAYLSQDRRRAGWVSGVLLTVASWIRLVDNDIEVVEWYTLPAATALLVYGIRRLNRGRSEVQEAAELAEAAKSAEAAESSWWCLGPGLLLALSPSLLLALDEPTSWRGLTVGLASVALVAAGVRLRLAAPFALGVLATALLALRNLWPVAAFIPRWTLLFLIGGILLGMGMTWESRVNDLRTANRYVRGLR